MNGQITTSPKHTLQSFHQDVAAVNKEPLCSAATNKIAAEILAGHDITHQIETAVARIVQSPPSTAVSDDVKGPMYTLEEKLSLLYAQSERLTNRLRCVLDQLNAAV